MPRTVEQRYPAQPDGRPSVSGNGHRPAADPADPASGTAGPPSWDLGLAEWDAVSAWNEQATPAPWPAAGPSTSPGDPYQQAGPPSWPGAEPGYPETGHPETGYPDAGYPEAGYPEAGYPAAGYAGYQDATAYQQSGPYAQQPDPYAQQQSGPYAQQPDPYAQQQPGYPGEPDLDWPGAEAGRGWGAAAHGRGPAAGWAGDPAAGYDDGRPHRGHWSEQAWESSASHGWDDVDGGPDPDAAWAAMRERPPHKSRGGLWLGLVVALVVVVGAAGGATWAASQSDRKPNPNAPTAPVAQPSADPNDGVAPADGKAGAKAGAKQEATTTTKAGEQQGNAAPAADFTFSDPAGWDDITAKARKSSSVGNRVVRALARVRDDGTGSSIVVTASDNPAPGSEPSTETLGAALRERTRSEGATEVSQPRTITMAGGQAVVVDYKGALRGQPIAGRRVLTVRGDNAYVLVLEGTEKRFAEDVGALDGVIETWRWK